MIGIDARMWGHAGIGRYVRELSKALLGTASADRFCFFGDEKKIRPDLGADVQIERAVSPIYSLSEQVEMARLSRRCALLHSPHFNIPFFGKRPFVVTIHDLIYLHRKDSLKNPLGRFYARQLMTTAARRASAILTVSEATKSDLFNLFPQLNPKKIHVIYEAASDYFRPLSSRDRELAQKKHRLHRPFFLFVGSLKPHKNITTLLKAIQSLRRETKMDAEVIVVGRADSKFPDILREIAAMSDCVRYLGELPDEDLVELYNLATAFVLPSFCEGFGLPVLEAMSCGAPILAARRASLPEIAGQAGRYFEPERVDALAELLYTVLKDKDLQEKMSRSSLERAATFSWQQTARQTLSVYNEILQ